MTLQQRLIRATRDVAASRAERSALRFDVALSEAARLATDKFGPTTTANSYRKAVAVEEAMSDIRVEAQRLDVAERHAWATWRECVNKHVGGCYAVRPLPSLAGSLA